MPLNKGDFVLIDYVARIKDTGEIFDLTIEEVAKEENVYRDDVIYEPMLVVVGEKWVLESLEEELMKMGQDEQKTIEFPPERAFGVRDPSKVRVISARELSRRGITPRVGARIEIDGRLAVIRSVGAGRVVVDFNHPLAGKTLVYDVKIIKKLESAKEKVQALIHRRIPSISGDKFGVKIRGKVLTITIPEEAFFIDDLQYAKRGVAHDVEKFFTAISTVRFVEAYSFKREEETASKG